MRNAIRAVRVIGFGVQSRCSARENCIGKLLWRFLFLSDRCSLLGFGYLPGLHSDFELKKRSRILGCISSQKSLVSVAWLIVFALDEGFLFFRIFPDVGCYVELTCTNMVSTAVKFKHLDVRLPLIFSISDKADAHRVLSVGPLYAMLVIHDLLFGCHVLVLAPPLSVHLLVAHLVD